MPRQTKSRDKRGRRTAVATDGKDGAGPSSHKVGELADAAGVSPQTIRLWEKQGLLQSARTEGGQRAFSADQLKRAQKIALLRRRHGWNPASIRSALGDARSEATKEAWREMSMGARVRAARRSRGMSLADLAKRSGISRSFLSTIERGENRISPGVLSALADTLDLPMSAFTPNVGPAKRVMRRSERPKTTMAEGVYWEELATPGHLLEPAVLVVPPGGSSGGAYTRPGEIFVTILAGKLAFEIGSDDFAELGRGDSILLEPFVSWGWRNPGRSEARAIYVELLRSDAWESEGA
jgi:DNA-binding transcriptional MerR regulator/quercetin dioxygenase-like cupin family protein